MGDGFSITNPSSWSLGNIAESAAEALTGSEFVGDLVGAGVSFATGDWCGGIENALDAGENAVAFLGDSRVADAAQDHFLGGSGGCTSPSQTTPAETGCSTGTGGTEGTKGGSLEDRIFELLMKLLEQKQGTLEEKLGNAEKVSKEAKAEKAASGGGGTTGESAGPQQTSSEQRSMFELQKAQDDLKQLSQLITGILSAQNESAMAVLRNIR